MAQLYIVALLAGTLTVFFDIAHQSFLPHVVEREQLVEGNSKLGISDSIAEVAGPPLGGVLVQLVSGPLTILLDAISFLVSAIALTRIRVVEPRPARAAERPHIRHDLLVGLRAIWADPLLRPIALSTAVRHFFGWFFGAIYGLYALRTLGLTPATLGLVVACGGIGSFLGAVVVAPATRRFGFGRATVGALVVEGAAGGLTWLAGGMVVAAVPLLAAAQIVGDMGDAASTINTVSLRQTITPDHMLGRVNASMRVLGQGIGTLGMLVGGVLAELIGLRPTVAVAVLGVMAGNLLLVYSPLRRLRALPAGPAASGRPAE
jgi:MFS family permease